MPNILADLDEDDTVPPLSRQMISALGARSQVTMPMLLAGEPIGAITLSWAEPRGYTDQTIALLQTFADQAVIAIENVRLFNETKEALERQTATADILKVIASSPSDVQPVFDAIATSAKRLIGGFCRCSLPFIDGNVHLAAFTPVSPAADAALKGDFPTPVDEFEGFRLARAWQAVPHPGHRRDHARADQGNRPAAWFPQHAVRTPDERRRSDRHHQRHARPTRHRSPTTTFSCCRPSPIRP